LLLNGCSNSSDIIDDNLTVIKEVIDDKKVLPTTTHKRVYGTSLNYKIEI